MTQLQTTDLDRLRACEAVVKRTKTAAWDFIRAIKEIQVDKLWKLAEPTGDEGTAQFASFEDYCERRHHVGKSYVSKLGKGLKAIEKFPLETREQINVSQAVALADVPEESRTEAYEAAVRDTDGRPTADAIREAAERIVEPNEPEDDPEPQPRNRILELAEVIASESDGFLFIRETFTHLANYLDKAPDETIELLGILSVEARKSAVVCRAKLENAELALRMI